MAGDAGLLLFGSPAFAGPAQRRVPLPWQRPTALLAVVACHRAGIARESLAALLRPEADASIARAHLRRNLNRVRAMLPIDRLRADDHRLWWDGDCDVVAFGDALAGRDWRRAIALQPQPLLDGVGPLGESALDEWIERERERLQGALRIALTARLAEPDADDGDRANLIARLVALDPFDESALRTALESARGPASRSAALTSSERAIRRLRDELGVSPSPDVLRLRDRVAGSSDVQAATSAPADRQRGVSFAWAGAAAPLVGRDAEVADIAHRFADGAARLVTLVGPGGVGKTRLALAVAEAETARRGAPAYCVDLREVRTTAAIATAICQAAGLVTEDVDPEARIREWLASSPVTRLIVLDNYEHLVDEPDARSLPQRLVDSVPSLRVLVTSREALGTGSEHRVAVAGLAVGGPAVALFEHHAHRLGVTLQPADRPVVAAIAAHLQGHPLGLELAASWLPVMPPAEILAELRRGLDFLGDEDAVRPDHRTLREVFETSWRLLEPRQQSVLAALTVCAGGADLQTAREVAGARPVDLARLVSKSLVQRGTDGLYVLHPLLRQFAARRLEPAQARRLRGVHAAHFADRVDGLEGMGLARADPDAVAWLIHQADNLRAAWWCAVETRRFDLVARIHHRLAAALGTGGWVDDMIPMWTAAADALPADDPLRIQLELALAGAWVGVGRMLDAERLLLRIEPRVGTPGASALLLAELAAVAHWRGDWAAATALSDRSLDAGRRARNPFALMVALYRAASSATVRGEFDRAGSLLDELTRLAVTHGAEPMLARARRLLSRIRHAQGRPDEARALMAACVECFTRLGDAFELAVCDRAESLQARLRGDRRLQLDAALRSVAEFARLGATAQHAASQYALALAQSDVGDPVAAIATLVSCLRTAMRLGRLPLVLRALGRLALLRATAAPGDRATLALARLVAEPGLRVVDRREFRSGLEALLDATSRAEAARAAAVVTIDEACTWMLADACRQPK